MKQAVQASECPKYGGKELGKGKHTGMGVVFPYTKVSAGTKIEYILCAEYGFIIEGM